MVLLESPSSGSRYLSAMRSLAQVRKLLKPEVAQINIGEKQQINTGRGLQSAPDTRNPLECHKMQPNLAQTSKREY